MNRRKFLGRSSVLTGVSFLPFSAIDASDVKVSLDTRIIKPKALKAGDTIGLITPGSALVGDAEARTVKNMERLGFKVIKSKNFNERTGFIAGSDQQRLDDIHEMFGNPKVDAIVCARGGYGTGRLLSQLNYDLIRANPKVLLGFSDITALHFAIFQNTGLVCYHGPVGSSEFSAFTTKQFKEVLVSGKKTTVKRPNSWKAKTSESYQYQTLVEGKAEGQLIGGNLSLICSLLGTPYDVGFENRIVFIEEVGESLYRVDRMLTQLLNSGKLDSCAGLILGIFESCVPKSGGVDDDGYVTLTGVIKDRLSHLKVPAAYGVPIGHIDDNGTIPIGIRASFDSGRGELKLLESAVG